MLRYSKKGKVRRTLCCTVCAVKADAWVVDAVDDECFSCLLSVGIVAEVDLRMGLQEKEGRCSRHQE